MNIIVLGAGAIGSFYGAKLSKLNNIILIAKKEHAVKINKNGLKMTGLEEGIFKIKADTEIREIKENTLILLTTKSYDSEKSINNIKNKLRKDTIIICLQNGLYSEDIAKKIVGNKCMVLRAITNFGAIFLEPGAVGYKNYSYTSIEKSGKSKQIADNFSKCGLNAYASKDIKYDMWKKVVFNCVLNPVTAILRIKNDGITDEKLNPLKKLIADECAEVAEKDGIKFGFDFVETINREFKGSQNVSSMQQDLTKGKITEIDYLNGAIAKLGKKYGIKCPVNEALAEIIKQMENKNQMQIFK
ncbi:MAG: 2-dehydropantoate 2-reductase [Nanoarchaeota archaeon]